MVVLIHSATLSKKGKNVLQMSVLAYNNGDSLWLVSTRCLSNGAKGLNVYNQWLLNASFKHDEFKLSPLL